MPRRPLRLVFLNQYFPPDEAATSQILGDLVDRAAAAGHECHVVTSNRCYARPEITYPATESRPGLEVRRVPIPGFGRRTKVGRLLDYLAFVAGATLAALAVREPDVVVSLSTPPILGALGAAVARLRGGRSVYWVMDLYPDVAFELGALSPRGVAGRLLELVSRAILRATDLVVALGETMAARLAALGATRVAVVHNWADEETVRPIPHEANAFRGERGWDGKLVVLYSGNLGLAHEFDTLLGAAERLRGETDVVFAFAGGGPRLDEVTSAIAARGLPNVEVHDGVPRGALGHSLSAGDLHAVTLRPRLPGLLVPSKLYGILAAGRPALYVGPAEGEVHDVLHRAACGTSVRNGDVDGLVGAILAYRRDPARRDHEGRRARELFLAEFTRRGQTERLLHLLEELAEARGSDRWR